ncbi:protoporphyrin IX magnesium-chelatase [Desulfotomaculum arcticum]|uniref:Protoporphyrin IX magnesium-chelatase n=1 Tax=Desulfotruncus arcticus DSM 17038 TaxID=1121424 RepID=A0A1I2WAH8_9FIRM|nr:magnesium chelatase subunit D family protein [Desulfotruncus arcticus]SFG98302.1 protoporphyrin IX magnesium-chelatase [Desulfotomaculum arcticum] [Desulfotruncus arcticus DSM 17038]
MACKERVIYPFSAIVGQEKMMTGLILLAINPKLGGILIQGERGTAKSTAVRGLAALLPGIEVVRYCRFSCDPGEHNRLCHDCREAVLKGDRLPKMLRQVRVVELPLAVTEDRLVGSLDLEQAVSLGRRKFEPGLLARANRGIIYIDEVNLLDYHLVNTLLDVAATGINVVEREGISYTHWAQLVIVGTMNQEEGELRPQLTDRFGLCVKTEGVKDPALRVQIIKRRESFEADPRGFLRSWAAAEESIRKRILIARELLPEVSISVQLTDLIVKLSLNSMTAGHRADILMAAAAGAVAAWNGRTEVIGQDVFEAAELVLRHRGREATNLNSQSGTGNAEHGYKAAAQGRQDRRPPGFSPPPGANLSCPAGDLTGRSSQLNGLENARAPRLHRMVQNLIQPFAVRKITPVRDRMMRNGSGRRLTTITLSKSGRYVRSTMQRRNNDLALDATVRAAAPCQKYRLREKKAIAIEPIDIREKIREKRVNNLLLFVVDASGSMGAQRRMVETKTAVLSLLHDAYQKRDKIGMVAFRDNTADILLPPTNSVELGQKLLGELPVGGMTPLSAGLLKAYEVAKASLRKNSYLSPLLIIITDGKGNVSMDKEKPLVEALNVAQLIAGENRIKTMVIDVERVNRVSFGVAQVMANIMGAYYFKIDELKSQELVRAVKFARS